MTGVGMYTLHIIFWLCSFFMPTSSGTWELSIGGSSPIILVKTPSSYEARMSSEQNPKDSITIDIQGTNVSLIDPVSKRAQEADLAKYLPIASTAPFQSFQKLMCDSEQAVNCVAAVSVAAEEIDIIFQGDGGPIPLNMKRVE